MISSRCYSPGFYTFSSITSRVDLISRSPQPEQQAILLLVKDVQEFLKSSSASFCLELPYHSQCEHNNCGLEDLRNFLNSADRKIMLMISSEGLSAAPGEGRLSWKRKLKGSLSVSLTRAIWASDSEDLVLRVQSFINNIVCLFIFIKASSRNPLIFLCQRKLFARLIESLSSPR